VEKTTYLFEASLPGVRANYIEGVHFFFKEETTEEEKTKEVQEAYNKWVLKINSGTFTLQI